MIHALALFLLVWLQVIGGIPHIAESLKIEPEPEPEVLMIFPEQVIPPALLPKTPPPKAYVRTSQNEASTVKPANAAFESDRNTLAASKLPPKADATVMMPTTEGNAPTKMELASRDFRDGMLKDDAVEMQQATPPTPDTPPAAPLKPPSILKPQPAPPPASPDQKKQVAKLDPADDSLLKKMMEEMDRQSASLDAARLPIEVRKPDAQSVPDSAMVKPQVRVPEDMPPAPPVPKAIPVPDDVRVTAGKPEKDAFSPFTRTAKNDGAISREGENAVDATATPRGIYMKKVTGAVEQKWHRYVRLARDSVTFGRVRFRFYVDQRGTPQDLRILSDAREADPRMREMTLRAILDADIPPMPPELIPELEDGRLKIEYEAIVY